MRKIKFNTIEIHINSDKDLYGQKITFHDGMNIIRAENTSGKTSIINSIYYVLGFESLLSNRKGSASLKPVLKREGIYKGDSFSVIESYILLEIENHEGSKIVVKRIIKGEIDSDLVKVFFGSLSEYYNEQLDSEFYYLNREGASQREKGFHKFLESWLRIQLPLVSRFQGVDVPLYLQCLIPLMFIEQTKGWTGIQATTPKTFGIQNLNKITIEYILNLDVHENKKKREYLYNEKNIIENEWIKLNEQIKYLAESINCIAKNFSSKPIVDFQLADAPFIKVIDDNKEIEVNSYLFLLREKLEQLEPVLTKSNDKTEIINELMNKLEEVEKERLIIAGKRDEVQHEIFNINSDIKSLAIRKDHINQEIKKHLDFKRILDLGGSLNISLTDNICPTCKQNVNDSLIPDIEPPMTIDDNINFLKEQKDALQLIEEENSIALSTLESKFVKFKSELNIIAQKIRSIKSDLYSNSEISESIVREQILLENKIREIEKNRDLIENRTDEYISISERYKNLLIEIDKLPKQFFSESDLDKLSFLKNKFSELIKSYGYRSTNAGDIEISKDTYLPICSIEGFEISLDASASDNIRIIWAYTVALLYTCTNFNTNHFGNIIFDEPEQQRMKEASSLELYRSISSIDKELFQCIICTSENKKTLMNKLNDLNYHYIELDDVVIRPKKDWYN